MMVCQQTCCRRQLPCVQVGTGLHCTLLASRPCACKSRTSVIIGGLSCKVNAEDLVGASLEGDSAVQVWSCTLDDGTAAQPKRYNTRPLQAVPLQDQSQKTVLASCAPAVQLGSARGVAIMQCIVGEGLCSFL